MNGLAATWRPREVPLAPVAVAATGEAARALARRALERGPEALLKLTGVAAEGILLLLGSADELPWADGAIYLGVDPAAPSLLLPCNREPDVPVALLERAALRASKASAPLALLPEPGALIPVAAARPVDAERLAAWLAR